MGADIKALRSRIKSVDSTLHLTKAMGLVASSKIRRASEAMLRSRVYAGSLDEVMEVLASNPECQKSAFMRASGERMRLIVIAGDRGLAGGYNANIFRLAKQHPAAEIIPIGKRACDRFGKRAVSSERFSSADAYQMAQALCEDFAANQFDRLCVLGTRYVSMMTQQAYMREILPLQKNEKKSGAAIVFEPDEITIMNAMIPEYVAGQIAMAVKESFACEVAARRVAMDNAGKNASQMIDQLQLRYNRARQSAITQEITEIVAGSGK